MCFSPVYATWTLNVRMLTSVVILTYVRWLMAAGFSSWSISFGVTDVHSSNCTLHLKDTKHTPKGATTFVILSNARLLLHWLHVPFLTMITINILLNDKGIRCFYRCLSTLKRTKMSSSEWADFPLINSRMRNSAPNAVGDSSDTSQTFLVADVGMTTLPCGLFNCSTSYSAHRSSLCYLIWIDCAFLLSIFSLAEVGCSPLFRRCLNGLRLLAETAVNSVSSAVLTH